MNYSNLLCFLAVIFALAAVPAPDAPWLPMELALPLFGLLLLAFSHVAARKFKAVFRQGSAAAYFAVENTLSLLAAFLFISSIFALDLPWHLKPLSLGGTLPVLAQFGGLLLFSLFLVLIWLQARPGYQLLFGSRHSAVRFIMINLRSNLPLVLPWFLLSLIFDLLRLLPWPGLQQTLASAWGEFLFFLIALLFLAVLFPPLISRLWGCTPLPPGPQRDEIEAFCRRQNFFAQLMSWPLLEGRAMTAAMMGIAPRFRYVLLTPALLKALDREELEAVLAHEIGHVKRWHILLYLVLPIAFSVLTEAVSGPLLVLLLSSNWFWRLLLWSGLTAERLAEYITGAVMLTLLLFYFRIFFAWFIRNFERQADLHAFQAQGSAWPLIRAFDKIVLIAGIRREKKNWHHFGIGERINFLVRCEIQPRLARRHDRKVYLGLTAYFLLIGLAVWLLPPMDTKALDHRARLQYASAMVEKKLREEPDNPRLLHLRADLLLENGKERDALTAYEQALRGNLIQAETLNNFAWLLLTAKERNLRNPVKALRLAERAAKMKTEGHVLDTLAEALWAAGRTDEAMQAARQAAELDPAKVEYYQAQAEKFAAESWH